MPIHKHLEDAKAKGHHYIGPRETWELDCSTNLEFTERGIQYRDSELTFINVLDIEALVVRGTIPENGFYTTLVIGFLSGVGWVVKDALPMIPSSAVVAVFALLASFILYHIWSDRYLAFNIRARGGSVVISMDMNQRNLRELGFLRQRVASNFDTYRLIFTMVKGCKWSSIDA